MKRTCAHIQCTHTHSHTHMNGVAHKSQLWCQPLNVYTTHKSHFRLAHSHVHTPTHTQVSELLRSVQTRLKLSPGSSVWSLVNLIWFRFLTWWIKNDKNVHFNLIYFPSWPWQHLYQPLCSGENARHFLRMFSQFKTAAKGMCQKSPALFLRGSSILWESLNTERMLCSVVVPLNIFSTFEIISFSLS